LIELRSRNLSKIILGDDIDVGPSVVLTALSGGKLIKLILKINFLLISRAIARFNAETFQRRANCYIIPLFYLISIQILLNFSAVRPIKGQQLNDDTASSPRHFIVITR